MFRRADELRRLLRNVAPRSITVDAYGDLPASFEVTVDAEDAALGVPFFETQGHVRETPSEFESSGGAVIERQRTPERHELRLSDEPFAIEGSHSVPVGSNLAAFVTSSETVRASLAALLDSFSETVGVEVDVQVERHVSRRLERASESVIESDYFARLDGLSNLGSAEHRPKVKEATLDVSRGEATDAEWEFDLSDHDAVFADALGDRRGKTDHLREARRSSGFTQQFDWEVENRRGGLSANVIYESENAPRYLDELRRRGVETPASTTFLFEYDGRGTKTSFSLDFETDGDPTTSIAERLNSWTGFVPLPVAPLVSYIS